MCAAQAITPENIKAAEKIFAEHGDFIYRIICYKLADKSLAEDIYQDFFITLSANPIALEGPQLKAYLYKTIVYDILNATRRVQIYQKNIKKFSEYCDSGVHKSDPRSAYTVEDKMEEVMRKAWEDIPSAQKRAISLRYLEGYSNAEVAEKMNIDPGSVRNYINRGMKKLRENMTNSREV